MTKTCAILDEVAQEANLSQKLKGWMVAPVGVLWWVFEVQDSGREFQVYPESLVPRANSELLFGEDRDASLDPVLVLEFSKV